MGYAGGVGPHSQLLTDGPTHSSFNKRSAASPPGHILKISVHMFSACTFRIYIIYQLTKPNISSMRQVCENYKIVTYLKESASVNDHGSHSNRVAQVGGNLRSAERDRHLTCSIHADYHSTETALSQLVHLALRVYKGGGANIQLATSGRSGLGLGLPESGEG
jgi:hypothetical protein